jgi:hypothetical protein
MSVPRRGRRPLVWGTCAAIVLTPAVAGALGGTEAAAGAVVGLGLVTAFFLVGRIPVRLAPVVPAALGFLLLGLGYALRIVLLVLALGAVRELDHVDGRATAATVILGALVWSFVQVGAHVTSRRPTIEPLGSRR